ncbi:MAG TPA: hypothetical protein VL754_22740 [Verrucomicrobiae bacterium]|jgi:hypothetical protein|nr:hypothetical protein [Verrucomicrobiae bacterium]
MTIKLKDLGNERHPFHFALGQDVAVENSLERYEVIDGTCDNQGRWFTIQYELKNLHDGSIHQAEQIGTWLFLISRASEQ